LKSLSRAEALSAKECTSRVARFLLHSKLQVTGTLPSKNIDTGMGLERISMIMQDKETLFDTDLFLPLSKELSKYVDKPNSKYEKVILDHLKSSTFMISDGVVPTNEGRGYILRRLIRRAIRAFNQVSTQEISLSF